MVDTSLAAFRLLELIALLFPVAALLLQLQHRAVDAEELEQLGLGAGTSILALLSLSFLLLSVYLVSIQSLPSLLSVALLTTSFISVVLPLLIVLASERFTDRAREQVSTVGDVMDSAWRDESNSNATQSEDAEDEQGQN